MNVRAHWHTLREQWRSHRIRAARRRLDDLLDRTPRYWRAVSVGGGAAIDLGCVTRRQATAAVAGSGRIVHVDRENAVVVLGGSYDPKAAVSPS